MLSNDPNRFQVSVDEIYDSIRGELERVSTQGGSYSSYPHQNLLLELLRLLLKLIELGLLTEAHGLYPMDWQRSGEEDRQNPSTKNSRLSPTPKGSRCLRDSFRFRCQPL